MKFKTNKVHLYEFRDRGYYYGCNHAVGKLSQDQLENKTAKYGKRITCKNCKKWYMKK